MDKKLVLFSGGLDSSVLLAAIVAKYGAENVIALNLFYGQKHQKEQFCAVKQVEHCNVELIQADLADVFKFDTSCPLLHGSDEDIPHESYKEQLDKIGGTGTVKTYVPFRNGLFLSYATAIALQKDADTIYYGAHADDAAGNAYPDCTSYFIASMQEAIHLGTGGLVHLIAPFMYKIKSEIVAEGISLDVDFTKTWSCYEGGLKACGICATCIDRKAAFLANGINDPLEYYK
jgi:7-cyano-7-deazaguanine synthase